MGSNSNNTENKFSSENSNLKDIDLGMTSSVGGIWNVGWEVFGIDCPDCALKISKSLNSLKGIEKTEVSIATTLVHFEIDLEIQTISKVNKILCDLGYA